LTQNKCSDIIFILEVAGMMRIKIEIVGDNKDMPEKEVNWRIPLKWLNPFRFMRKTRPEPDTPKGVGGEENERPEGWVHPPFP
jgi:hypothetical protein